MGTRVWLTVVLVVKPVLEHFRYCISCIQALLSPLLHSSAVPFVGFSLILLTSSLHDAIVCGTAFGFIKFRDRVGLDTYIGQHLLIPGDFPPFVTENAHPPSSSSSRPFSSSATSSWLRLVKLMISTMRSRFLQ